MRSTAAADPLARLVVDQVETDRELLATTLEGKVRIDPSRGEFTFLPRVRAESGNRRLVLIALLARKALHLLSKEYPEGALPRELEAVTGVRGNTLRPILKQLVDKGIIRRLAGGEYMVPNYSLEDTARDLGAEVTHG